MSWLWVALGIAYVGLAGLALVKTRVFTIVWLKPVREVLPETVKGFWGVYPARFWPGPLKVIGYPMTFLFLAVVILFFILFQSLLLLVISPKAIWWSLHRSPGQPRGGPDLPPAVAAKQKAAG